MKSLSPNETLSSNNSSEMDFLSHVENSGGKIILLGIIYIWIFKETLDILGTENIGCKVIVIVWVVYVYMFGNHVYCFGAFIFISVSTFTSPLIHKHKWHFSNI